ncbi:MAG: peptidylprolyl isomerase [Arenicellales bacterium]
MRLRLPLSILCVGWIVLFNVWAQAQTPINRVLVVVNENVITQSDLDKRVSIAALEARSAGQRVPPYKTLAPQLLEEMIVDRLLLEIAALSNISVAGPQVDYALSVIAAQNRMGVSELKAAVEQAGVSFEDYRDDLKRQLIIRQVINARIGRSVSVSVNEIDEYLAQNPQPTTSSERKIELAQVVIPVAPGATAEERLKQQRRAENIRSALSEGVALEQVAERFADGGAVEVQASLGMRDATQLPDIFLTALSGVSPGGLSAVFETPRGWHVLKLIRIQEGNVKMVQQRELRHILMRQSALLPKDQVRSRLERTRDRIQAGEDFATVAKLQSEDASTRAAGGSLGWVDIGTLPPEFEQAIEGLVVNEVSPVFETAVGFHIAQVTGEREVDIGEDLRRREAEQSLRARKSQEALEQWTQSLREEAYVQYRVQFDD